MNKKSIINEINSTFKLNRELYPDEKQAFFDLNNYLFDDLLVKVDRSSMYSSLEARVPILDHNVVEFALNLHRDLKVYNGVQKFLLKELTYEYIPKKIIERPKWGFTIPLSKWLKNDLKFMINKYLNTQMLSKISFINTEEVLSYKNRFLAGEEYLWNRVWTLLVLVKFLNNQDELQV